MEAARVAREEQDYLTRCAALRHLAVIRSIHGDHTGSLSDLERLLPIVRYVAGPSSPEYYALLNSIAVELGEVGRIKEANAAVDAALRSPFSVNYPDWRATKLELAAKQPKVFTPLVFALGALHQAQVAIQPTRENRKAAQLAAPEVKTSENPAADVQAQPAQAPNAIRRIPIIFIATFKGRICDPSFAGALRLLKSPSALSPNRPGYSISPPSRAPPTIDPRHDIQTPVPCGIPPSSQGSCSSLGLVSPTARGGTFVASVLRCGRELANSPSQRGPPSKLACRSVSPPCGFENIRAPIFVLSTSGHHPDKEPKHTPGGTSAVPPLGFLILVAQARFRTLIPFPRHGPEGRSGLVSQERSRFLERAGRALLPKFDGLVRAAAIGEVSRICSAWRAVRERHVRVHKKGASPDGTTKRG
jgi:hypothetical protein